jgi:hypothetical protein
LPLGGHGRRLPLCPMFWSRRFDSGLPESPAGTASGLSADPKMNGAGGEGQRHFPLRQ